MPAITRSRARAATAAVVPGPRRSARLAARGRGGRGRGSRRFAPPSPEHRRGRARGRGRRGRGGGGPAAPPTPPPDYDAAMNDEDEHGNSMFEPFINPEEVPDPVDEIEDTNALNVPEYSAFYENSVGVVEQQRVSKSYRDQVIHALSRLEPGYALFVDDGGGFIDPVNENTARVEVRLAGYTLREIAQLVSEIGADVDLSQYYVSGICVDFYLARRNAVGITGANGGSGGSVVRRNQQLVVQNRTLVNICLADVAWPAGSPAFEVANSSSLSINEFLNSFRDDIFRSEEGGSDLSTYVLSGNIRIVRAAPYPSVGAQRFRTGGFEKFFLEDTIIQLRHSNIAMRNPNRIVYIPGGIDRYQSGLINCVIQCLAWGLYNINGVCREDVNRRVIGIYNQFYDNYLAARMRDTPVDDPSYGRKLQKIQRQWKVMIQHGFSATILNRFIRFLYEFHKIVFLFYRLNRDNGKFVPQTRNFPEYFVDTAIHDNYEWVDVFQICVDGSFLTTSRILEDDLPGLLHCIAVWPDRLAGYDLRDFQYEQHEDDSTPHESVLAAPIQRALRAACPDKYDEISSEELEKLVEAQRLRHKALGEPTRNEAGYTPPADGAGSEYSRPPPRHTRPTPRPASGPRR